MGSCHGDPKHLAASQEFSSHFFLSYFHSHWSMNICHAQHNITYNCTAESIHSQHSTAVDPCNNTGILANRIDGAVHRDRALLRVLRRAIISVERMGPYEVQKGLDFLCFKNEFDVL